MQGDQVPFQYLRGDGRVGGRFNLLPFFKQLLNSLVTGIFKTWLEI